MICDARIHDELLVDAYLMARNVVVRAGYAHELEWQRSRDFERLSERDFLRESAWVVLASGMNDLVVRRKFPAVSAAFHWWHSSKSIVCSKSTCRTHAMRVFGHKGKIDAIITIALVIFEYGFPRIRSRLCQEGVEFIRTLPYMGPATSFHLAKNIGLQVAKPDRHLCRIAIAAGYDNPCDMCRRIAEFVNDTVPVIDIVLWRFATLVPEYTNPFTVISS